MLVTKNRHISFDHSDYQRIRRLLQVYRIFETICRAFVTAFLENYVMLSVESKYLKCYCLIAQSIPSFMSVFAIF
jgi:hypothetical protein